MQQVIFADILERVRTGAPADLKFEADGQLCVRHFYPRERLILLGGGHIAQPLCAFASAVGFSVVVVDDRAEFADAERFPEAAAMICDDFANAIQKISITPYDYVAVITRGHKCDGDCLRAILPETMPRYLGMIGSRSRTKALLDLLESEGFARERLNQIHTPIGLAIGALTIEEIAISIVAQLIQCRRETTDRYGRNGVLTSEEVNDSLLEFLAESQEPKAIMIVCDTEGSTPAKSGAIMAIDTAHHTEGTIGGGRGEHEVMQAAYDAIGSGESFCMTVDMNHDVAADEGMVCGGRMKVWISDLQ